MGILYGNRIKGRAHGATWQWQGGAQTPDLPIKNPEPQQPEPPLNLLLTPVFLIIYSSYLFILVMYCTGISNLFKT